MSKDYEVGKTFADAVAEDKQPAPEYPGDERTQAQRAEDDAIDDAIDDATEERGASDAGEEAPQADDPTAERVISRPPKDVIASLIPDATQKIGDLQEGIVAANERWLDERDKRIKAEAKVHELHGECVALITEKLKLEGRIRFQDRLLQVLVNKLVESEE